MPWLLLADVVDILLAHPVPSSSVDAFYVIFSGMAVIEYEPENVPLSDFFIETAHANAPYSTAAIMSVVIVQTSTSIYFIHPSNISLPHPSTSSQAIISYCKRGKYHERF
ncbi:hypothetical protein I4P18_07575 [Enterobacter roggenkampii]|nr:hypothetical protein [Enterobacter roggenkampii]